jgi:hypothetical protein
MAFVILCLQVKPVLRQQPLDLVRREHADGCPDGKVGHSGEG